MDNRGVALALAEALTEQGFGAAVRFGVFVTYERINDSIKVHVGPDGSFAAFDNDDQIIAEGKGVQDLFTLLVGKTIAPRLRVPAQRSAS
jgi:hypothetical protein